MKQKSRNIQQVLICGSAKSEVVFLFYFGVKNRTINSKNFEMQYLNRMFCHVGLKLSLED